MHSLSVIPARASREARPDSWRTQAPWFGAAAVVGFAVPFLGSSILELQHDVYLAIYFAAVLALFAAYVRSTRLDVWTTLTRHWKLGSLLGVVFGVLLVRNVLSEPRPPGLTVRTSSLRFPGPRAFVAPLTAGT